MKGLKTFCAGKVGAYLLTVLVVGGFVSNSQAQFVNLASLNSTASVDLGSASGMYSWTVDGVNQLYSQSLWYRIGSSGPESSVSSISSAIFSLSAANQLTALYSNASISVQVSYLLTGNTGGSGQSGLNQSIKIVNTSGASEDIHFFQYSDFDLGGTPLNQNVTLNTNNSGFYSAYQTLGSASLTESVIAAANHGEANLYANTLNSLTDSLTTTLNNNTTAGPGDVTYAFEWDFLNLGAGGSKIISKIENLSVPEPSSMALFGFALASCAIWLRGRKRI